MWFVVQSHVADELHLARSEKRLEVNVMQSYGELTCMDIDSPEEGATDSQCKLEICMKFETAIQMS